MAHILISEPEAAVNWLLEHIVTQLGHVATASPEQAHDVLIVEPVWPAARELAERLRRDRPGLPIVCVSCEWLPAFADDFNVSAYLSKPFTLEELEAAVIRAVDEAEGAAR